jgi:hypothetical protein
MKLIKYAVAAALALAWGNAQAFHSGGVAECEGCHSMHNSYEGSANVTGMAQFASGPYLLKASDQSGACLNCHEAADPGGYHISTPGAAPYVQQTALVGLTPGGDFAWLKKTMNTTIRGKTVVDGNLGERHGHNIIAADFGYVVDSTQKVAPGSLYPNTALACSSCHDPHGKYRRFADGSVATTGLPIFNSGSYTSSKDPIAGVAAVGVYRILGGSGYQPKSLAGSFGFANNPPDAVAKSTYNIADAKGNATSDVVAYGRGMSEWCGNCHSKMVMSGYTSGMKGLVHPAGNGAKLTATIAANYNAYVSSGIMTGSAATAYSALAPFEIGSGDYASLKTLPQVAAGAAITNNVLCLSCHRAHASGFESMARYSLTNEFMTIADASNAAAYDSSVTENKVNFGYDVTTQTLAYNNAPASKFGPYARNYCNKCHAKD